MREPSCPMLASFVPTVIPAASAGTRKTAIPVLVSVAGDRRGPGPTQRQRRRLRVGARRPDIVDHQDVVSSHRRRRVDREFLRAHHSVTASRGARYQHTSVHQLHRLCDRRQRMNAGPVGERGDHGSHRNGWPRHRAKALLMQQDCRQQQFIDDLCPTFSLRANRMILVHTQRGG